MADINARIEQFKKMADADPENVLGHFSLGRAYQEAGIHDGAISSFQKVIGLDENMSRAYELLATSLLQRSQKEAAIDTLTKGVKIAGARGDVMPKNAMAKMLEELGAPVPAVESTQPAQVVGEGQVLCSRCGQVGRKLPAPPFRNDQGRMILEKICADCWREWIGMGTKVINELRLPLNDPQAQKLYDQHMYEFLNLK